MVGVPGVDLALLGTVHQRLDVSVVEIVPCTMLEDNYRITIRLNLC